MNKLTTRICTLVALVALGYGWAASSYLPHIRTLEAEVKTYESR